MKADRSSKIRIIRESYIRLLLVNIATLAALNLCGFVDSIIISKRLDTLALAAVGYFSPLSVVTGLPSVVILGTGLLCGNLIGSGQQEKVKALFTSASYAVTAFCVLFSVLTIVAREPLSTLLGAYDDSHRLLQEYIVGFVPGIVFSSLTAMLMSLASYNNEINRSYVAIGMMFFGNLVCDILFVPLGIFGIGLASTISSFAAFAVMLPPYLKKTKTICFNFKVMDMGLVIQAAGRGLPALLFTAGLLIKNSLLNNTLSKYTGYEGIAVANLLTSVCGIAGTLSGGCTNAFANLASLYYGAEDREGLMDVFRFALRVGIIFTALLTAALMGFHRLLAGFFFPAGGRAGDMAQNMFLLGFLFLPINVVINLLMNAFKAQGRMRLVNIISFAEVSLIGLLVFITVPRFGSDAAWLANTWSDLLALGVIFLSVLIRKKGWNLGTADWLKLPETFGAGRDEFVEYTVSALSDVSGVSQSVIDFCIRRGTDRKKAYYAGLCAEEITGNILEHGSFRAGHCHINIRVVCKNELTIRVQDDCRQFDPRERMNMYTPENPEKNIGLRMVARMATYVDYYNNAGINTLILKF